MPENQRVAQPSELRVPNKLRKCVKCGHEFRSRNDFTECYDCFRPAKAVNAAELKQPFTAGGSNLKLCFDEEAALLQKSCYGFVSEYAAPGDRAQMADCLFIQVMEFWRRRA